MLKGVKEIVLAFGHDEDCFAGEILAADMASVLL
jgi:hypothetical protein